MLDYKNIIIKRYTLNLSFKELAEEFGASKSGVNDFIRAFEKCDKLSYPLPEGISNYAISELVYGHVPGSNNRSSEYEQPDFEYELCIQSFCNVLNHFAESNFSPDVAESAVSGNRNIFHF